MIDVITIGDAMITFDPNVSGPLRFAETFTRRIGGAELNVAIGCSRLGLKTAWIGRLGDDEFGRYIYNFARGEGIDVSEVKLVKGYPTSLNFKEIRADGSSKTSYYRYRSPTETLTVKSLNEKLFQKSRLLHISGVFPAIRRQNIEIIDRAIILAKQNDLKISLDPNIRLKLWDAHTARNTLLSLMPSIDYLLTGIDEAEILFGTKNVLDLIDIAKQYSISNLFIKMGEKGAKHWSENQLIEQPPAKTSKVVDVVGAGDGFNAGAIYGLLNNWSPQETLKFATTIGAMVVEVIGDNEGLPYLEEVMHRLRNNSIIER